MNNNPIPFALALRLCRAGLPQPFGWAYTDKGVLIDATEPLQYLGNVCCAAPTYEKVFALLSGGRMSDAVRRDCKKILEEVA